MDTNEKLAQLQQALLVEKNEEILLFEQKVLNTPLQERKKEGITWHPVQIKEERPSLGGKIYLEVENPDPNAPNPFQGGQIVALFSNQENQKKRDQMTAVVVKSKGSNLLLAINEDETPDWLYEGRIGIDLYFEEASYKEMERAINIFIKADKRAKYLKEVLFGEDEAQFAKKQTPFHFPNLNEAQNLALTKIDSSYDVAIIHGPPGTGKTTTLVEAIKLVVKTEKQVLVCAPSNAAVDLLTFKLANAGLKVLRIGHPARVSEFLWKYTVDGQFENHAHYKELKGLYKLAGETKAKASKFKRNFGQEERNERKELSIEAKNILKDAYKLEDYIFDDILSGAQVILSTLVGAANSKLHDKSFNTVFIDEAAQALTPATLIAILKANRVVLAGDHCQLPPTVKSYDAEKLGLAQTLMENLIQKQADIAVMLDTQYRMNQSIMQFSSQQFYHNDLKAHSSVAHNCLTKKDGSKDEENIVWIDTAGAGYEEQTSDESSSLSNPDEATFLFNWLNEYSKEVDIENVSVGIIAPYKDQVKLLSKTKDLYPNLKHVRVDTVDSFQGQESNLIIISMVRSNSENIIGFLGDLRRMNVAMTRAQSKLVMIGDSSTLGGHHFYQKLLEFVEKNGSYRSVFEWVFE